MPSQHRRERLVLFVLGAIQFSHTCDFVIMMPLGPQLMRVLHLSPAQFSLLVSSYTWSAGVAGFIASLFIDRFDRRRVLLGCYFGFIVGTTLCGLSDRYSLLLAARVVAGAFGGILAAAIFAILADVIPESRRGAATGIVLSAFSVASVLGIPIGLFLAAHYSWSLPFLAIAALGVGIWGVAAWQIPSLKEHLQEPGSRTAVQELWYVLTHRTHVRAYCLSIFLIVGGFLVIPFISPYLVANVGLREADLPYVYFVGGLFTFFSSRFIGRLSDRFGALRVYVGVALSSTIPFLWVTHLPRVSFTLALVATSVFFILVSGRWVPAMTLIASSSEARVRGSFLSLNSSIQQLALGLATFLSGLIVGQDAGGRLTHYGTVGWLATGVTLASLGLAYRLSSAKNDGVSMV